VAGPARMIGEPLHDCGMLVGRVIVEDGVLDEDGLGQTIPALGAVYRSALKMLRRSRQARRFSTGVFSMVDKVGTRMARTDLAPQA
jgi:hypothetical protein